MKKQENHCEENPGTSFQGIPMSMHYATPIGKVSFEYSVGKSLKSHNHNHLLHARRCLAADAC